VGLLKLLFLGCGDTPETGDILMRFRCTEGTLSFLQRYWSSTDEILTQDQVYARCKAMRDDLDTCDIQECIQVWLEESPEMIKEDRDFYDDEDIWDVKVYKNPYAMGKSTMGEVS
jgi:hypothetical protein